MQVAANQRNSHPMYIFHLSLPEYRKFDYNYGVEHTRKILNASSHAINSSGVPQVQSCMIGSIEYRLQVFYVQMISEYLVVSGNSAVLRPCS